MTALDRHVSQLDSLDPQLFTAAKEWFRHAHSWSTTVLQVPSGRSPESLLGMVDAAWRSIDTDIQALLNGPRSPKPACKAGCSMCCYQDIHVTIPELLFLAMRVQDRPGAAAADRQAKRIVELRAAGQLSPDQRFAAAVACPFLRNRLCIAHDVRPSVCRGYLSSSLGACKADWAARKKPGTSPGIPIISGPDFLAQSYVMGMCAAMMQAGLEVERVELSAGIAALEGIGPDAILRWAKGERLFQDCYHTSARNGLFSAVLVEALASTGVAP